eukprot:TRINITY_DN12512_c0_g1_i1.p1 TRINITY_DN12512_c0_g1~~TRINITY_DN12512_c0_g1_i1.p1  ORF type:complete len:299 (+),score=74.18 TRINITY_DN12512_c0_g1_i1:79-975(+)
MTFRLIFNFIHFIADFSVPMSDPTASFAALEQRETGYSGRLTPKQQEALDAAKVKITAWAEEDETRKAIFLEEKENILKRGNETEDVLVLRFLRARNWNVDVASDLFTSTIIWRRDFQGIGVNNLNESMIQNELKSGKSFLRGVDKVGRPVTYIKVGLHSKSKSDPLELQRFCIYMFEKGRKELKPPIETTTVILDMKGFNLECLDYPFTKFLIDTFATKYPESLGWAFLLDPPWIFKGAWAVIKPWMDAKTLEKIKFLNKREELKMYIDEDQLLKEYGGTDAYVYQYPDPHASEDKS